MATPRLAYLNLLRASSALFHGDTHALGAARFTLRQAFEERRGERDAARAADMLSEAREAAEFMRNNLVQAKRTPRGTYAVELKPDPVTNEFAPLHPDDVQFKPSPVSSSSLPADLIKKSD
jgi:hypothetical protein